MKKLTLNLDTKVISALFKAGLIRYAGDASSTDFELTEEGEKTLREAIDILEENGCL